MHDSREAEYACLSHTLVVCYLELPRPPRPLAVTPPLRILGMVASPKDQEQLDVAQEKQRVQQALKGLHADGLVELRWLPGQTWRDLQRAMRRGPWHVFHFIGHGGFDQARDEGFIALADEREETRRLTATQLGRLLANHRSLRLALLNSCEGARGGGRDVFSSTASILVRRGIPAVLAMQDEITDRAAIELARTLYEALADGMPVDAALVEARTAISMALTNTVEWGTPVLYMRAPDGVLFEIRGQRTASRDGGRIQPQAQDRVGESRPVMAAPIVQVDDVAPAPARQRLVELHRILNTHLDLEEMRTLCFYVGIEYDNLRGEGMSGKARELIKFLDNRGQIPAFVESGKQLRPDIAWPAMPEPGRAFQPTRALAGPRIIEPVKEEKPDLFSTRKPFEPEMVLIPAGEFLMGSDPKKDKLARDNEQPQHTLYLPDYYMARTPATNTQYAAFVEATGHRQPQHWQDGKHPGDKEEHPVVRVSWHDAVVYCRWLSQATSRPYRLPTEAEWEKAARGTDGRIYPWGDEFDSSKCNMRDTGIGTTSAVDMFPAGASPYGVMDLSGNVWEWCATRWQEKYPLPQVDEWSEDYLGGMSPRVWRGGAFVDLRRFVRGAGRRRSYPYNRSNALGFRVAVAASPGSHSGL